MIKGIPASSGIGIGVAVTVTNTDLHYTPQPVSDIEAEVCRFDEAVDAFCKQAQERAQRLKASVGAEQAEILSGHILMIRDPYMSDQIRENIRSGQCAEAALDAVCDVFIEMFSSAEDQITQQRAADVRDIRNTVLGILLGKEDTQYHLSENSILIAEELTPTLFAQIDMTKVAGLVARLGGQTSHSAILARSMNLPAVLGVSVLPRQADGKVVIVDGDNGEVFIDADEETVNQYEQKRNLFLQNKRVNQTFFGKKSVTADGMEKQIVCNIGTVADIRRVLENDGQGIGLFRTEFLFMNTALPPTEEQQFAAYKNAAVALQGKTVTIRTLDVGGDKAIPYLNLSQEENPFLGFRAVRFCLQRSELFKTQLRAILRASAFGDIQCMIPLITCIEELRDVKKLICECQKELDNRNVSYNKNMKVGVMIETPSAAMISDLLATECDFFSIGTNDLIQYTMCADRTNNDVSYLYSAYQPSVLMLIQRITDAAKRSKIPVSICGEAAADSALLPVFVSMGIDKLSLDPSFVLQTRRNLSVLYKTDCDALTLRVLQAQTQQQVCEILK